ncbi:hypothetical protein GCM10028805_11350 [Spirosoma harenae]
MDSVQQSYPSSAPQNLANGETSLSLYDRYGSLAYGIILQIIPEPELAQTVLIDLFTSPEVKSYSESPLLVSSKLIQLARSKALKVRPAHFMRSLSVSPSTNDDLGKLVFDLSFYEGYNVQEIAEKLNLSRANILNMIAVYFKQQRTSK